MSGELRCWQCGVEPLDVIEDRRLGQAEPTYIPGRWPAADHTHEVAPPTPEELVERGQASLDRIRWALLD